MNSGMEVSNRFKMLKRLGISWVQKPIKATMTVAFMNIMHTVLFLLLHYKKLMENIIKLSCAEIHGVLLSTIKIGVEMIKDGLMLSLNKYLTKIMILKQLIIKDFL